MAQFETEGPPPELDITAANGSDVQVFSSLAVGNMSRFERTLEKAPEAVLNQMVVWRQNRNRAGISGGC